MSHGPIGVEPPPIMLTDGIRGDTDQSFEPEFWPKNTGPIVGLRLRGCASLGDGVEATNATFEKNLDSMQLG